MNKVQCIANFRVSSPEQEKNGSLSSQEKAVRKMADELNAEIVRYWSGNVSSKKGTNTGRKDLKEMLEFCKRNPRVEYAIIDVPDRFMRSIKEAFYFEVSFEELGVRVFYASKPELNEDTLFAKLQRFMEYFGAEKSNDERIEKSIKGHTDALKEGRFTFPCRLGYIKGVRPGVHVQNPDIAPTLKRALERMAVLHITPQQGMKEINTILIGLGRAPLKMDKWRKIIIDPYFCGVVSMDKQIKVSNPDGQHEALISPKTHERLVEIMNGRPKTQTGAMKGGNPRFPCNNIVTCTICVDAGITNGRVVGFPVKDGRYEKYRCRGCRRYMTREELHNRVEKRFSPINTEANSAIVKALEKAWRRQEKTIADQAAALKRKIDGLTEAVTTQAVEAVKPENQVIKDELLRDCANKKERIVALRAELVSLQNKRAADKTSFLKFALDFVGNFGRRFLEVSRENRHRLELLLFPGGFFVDANKKVLTPKTSPFYRLMTIKKDAEASDLALMVRVTGL